MTPIASVATTSHPDETASPSVRRRIQRSSMPGSPGFTTVLVSWSFRLPVAVSLVIQGSPPDGYAFDPLGRGPQQDGSGTTPASLIKASYLAPAI